MLHGIKAFAGDLKRATVDLSIVIGVVAFFQFAILQEVPNGWPMMLMGLVIVLVGLALFTRGLEEGIFPLGDTLVRELSKASTRAWIILFAFIIGFATTLAEPALIAIADRAATISGGAVDAFMLRVVASFAVGIAMVLGVIRIIIGHPIHWYIIGGYVMVLGLTYFVPPELVGLAFDSGGVTTGVVTVPIIAALGIGLASVLKNRNPIIDGFGLVALATVIPVIFVQLYGIFLYTSGSMSAGSLIFEGASATPAMVSAFSFSVPALFDKLVSIVLSVGPIVFTIIGFFWLVLRQPIPEAPKRIVGFVFVTVGLYAFIIGLQAGLFPIGESLAASLATFGNVYLLYAFAFTMGFATTVAEPALSAIARRAEEVSGGSINAFLLRIFVALGVGSGILLGTYRIVQGDSIFWYIIGGYVLVVILTLFAPRTIIPIAYDAGGVTTSEITVPVITALGLGLAASIPGRNALMDGFGLIAFAVLFAMITVLAYGIAKQGAVRRYEKYLNALKENTVERILKRIQEEDTPVITRTKKEIIAITGQTGSGVSVAARALAEKLQYHYFSSGAIFETVAEAHHMTPNQLAKHAEHDSTIDQEIDELIQELGIKNTRLVIDSELAYHWINRSFKVYLECGKDICVERIFERKKEKEPTLTYESLFEEIDTRHESKRRRYQDRYGIDIENKKPFDLVLDTSTLHPEEVVEKILSAYNKWRTIKNK